MVKPTNFDELYPNRFLKAGLLKGQKVTVTISDVFIEELEGEKGIEQKAILTMAGKKMQLVLCKLNGLCVKAMFGPSIGAWLGKRITLWPTDTIMPMKKGEDCIRVWGSPDIGGDFDLPIQFRKRKAFSVTLHKVTLGAPILEPPPTPAPASDDSASNF